MSIEAVVGRVDQILAMRQQLVDPAAASNGSGAAARASGAAGATAGTTPASFTAALNSAMASSALGTGNTSGAAAGGLLPSALASGAGAGMPSTAGALPSTSVATTTTGSAATQVQAMTDMANSLVGKPYVYGGGHGSWAPQSGYDCSGFVSAVLHAGGYLSQPVDTTALPSQPGMLAGPGQHVTVYDRALPGQNGHVIIEINGQFYESGGSRGPWGGGGGVEKIGTPSAAYLAQFPNVLHPAGL